MSRLENIRTLASQAGQTMYTVATVGKEKATMVASVSKEKATLVASVSKEKGRQVYAHAAVAASASRSTIGIRLKQVQTSSTYQNVKQKLWSKSSNAATSETTQYASTEKEYYKMDPAKIVKPRTQSSREHKREGRPALKRSATTATSTPASASSFDASRTRELTVKEVEF